MKTDQIKVGGRYYAKVSGRVVPVRITGERWVGEVHKGWNAVNTATNRPVVVKSAQRLRSEIKDDAHDAPGGAAAKDAPEAKPAPAAANGADVAGVGGPGANGAAPKASPLDRKIMGKEMAERFAAIAPPVGNAAVAAAGSPRPPKAAKGGKAPKAKPAPKPKAEKKAKPAREKKPRKMSGLDAVAQVLAEAGKPMSAKDMTDEALKRGLWKTGGKTPHATVYAAIIRDIAARGKESRFRKTGRGLFAAAGKGA